MTLAKSDSLQMQRTDIDGEPVLNLFEVFKGLGYTENDGMAKYGESKNIYTEDYPESESLRVYVPTDVQQKATEIKLTFLFTGENRRSVYDSFFKYVSVGTHRYWDNVRNRSFEFILTSSPEVSEDILIGGTPYIEVSFTFQNIKGFVDDTTSNISNITLLSYGETVPTEVDGKYYYNKNDKKLYYGKDGSWIVPTDAHVYSSTFTYSGIIYRYAGSALIRIS